MPQIQSRYNDDHEFEFDIVDIFDDGTVSLQNMSLADAQHELAKLKTELLHAQQVRLAVLSHLAELLMMRSAEYSSVERTHRGEGSIDRFSQEKHCSITLWW